MALMTDTLPTTTFAIRQAAALRRQARNLDPPSVMRVGTVVRVALPLTMVRAECPNSCSKCDEAWEIHTAPAEDDDWVGYVGLIRMGNDDTRNRGMAAYLINCANSHQALVARVEELESALAAKNAVVEAAEAMRRAFRTGVAGERHDKTLEEAVDTWAELKKATDAP